MCIWVLGDRNLVPVLCLVGHVDVGNYWISDSVTYTCILSCTLLVAVAWVNTCMYCLCWCCGVPCICILPLWFTIWSITISFCFYSLSFLQVMLLLGGGLLRHLNTYRLSFSLHLSNLVMYPPHLPQRQHCFPWCVSSPSYAVATDAISEDKCYFYIIIALFFEHYLCSIPISEQYFLTSIWSCRCLVHSEYGLESTHALKQKCTKGK